jgi:peptide/nickel transport system substrate-binding protein
MHTGFGQSISRRSALRLLGSSATVALLAACAPLATAPPAPTPNAVPAPTSVGHAAAASTPATASQPQRGGVLRAGMVGDVGAINPHAIGPQPLQTIFSIWDRLIAYDPTGKPEPMLAESWDFSADQTKLQFKIRKGVQFHSGRELSSEDVKWNLLRVRNPAVNATQFNKQSLWFTNIDTSDRYAIVLTLDRARPSVLDFFELFNIGDSETLDPPSGTQPRWIGTGPFKLAEYVVGDHLNFSRNENYWRSDRPLLDQFNVNLMATVRPRPFNWRPGCSIWYSIRPRRT